MATLLRNRFSSPVTLPYPYNGVIPPGGSVVLTGAPAAVVPRLGSQAADVFEVLEVPDHDLSISPTNGTFPAPSTGGAATWGAVVGTLADQTDLATALGTKVVANTAITGDTKTKVTYAANGLVTAGVDATTADIADSTDKRYVTDAKLAVLASTSGTNTGDQGNADATHAGVVSTAGQTFGGAKRSTEVALVSVAAVTAVDLDLANEFSLAMAEDSTLAAPTHAVAGQVGSIAIAQGATWTLAYDTFWKFPGAVVPSLTASAGAVDLLEYRVLPGGASAACRLVQDIR